MTDDNSPSIDDLLHEKAFEAVIALLSSWSASKLAEFCMKSPDLYDILKSNAFDEFWKERRQTISKYAFKAQHGVCDADLTVGHTLYLLAQREKAQGNLQRYQEYLSQALNCHSIHAAQSWVHEIVIAADKPDLNFIQTFAAILYSRESLAKRHGTPGYLLLANGYFHLLHALTQINREASPNEWKTQYEGSLFSLWKSLFLARQAEKQSTEAIHNAYYGCGLKNSNPFSLETIDAMLEKCDELHDYPALRERARHAAVLAGKPENALTLWASAQAKVEQPCKQDVFKSPKM
ncbi:hypothetical protein GH742_05315 [Legionella sp. MW5194]|uniref:DUF5630 domain-containing protein n=1 Tax=Legionella sp. MW5194 TaxID=2662448 RepID=UPI00193E1C43|nr:DUF5630 domain-containing protein [Legionella sp. MW5194]QRN03329.1 hypothetical protein GH742_05315 [Legionella sp. MW5194]